MIGVKELKKTYGRGTRTAEEVLHGVSFELPETGFVCILGRSGSGKTSLLNAIGGLDTFDSGSVEIDGVKITRIKRGEMEKQRNEKFGYVFQNYYLLPEHSAAYNVYLGLNSLDLSEKEKIKRVGEALDKVGMRRFKKRLVGELSGGQQQRVAIARAIAKAPEVIFADEPTGNLDEESTLNICSLLKELSKTSLVVMVTHEERLADFFADRIIRIADGDIESDETEWERGTLVSADNNTVYADDYNECGFSNDSVSVRVLAAEGAAPANITLVIEDGRLVIKTDDSRLIMYSKTEEPPLIKEGNRPKLDPARFENEVGGGEAPVRTKVKTTRKGIGLGMLLAELRTSASKKKLRNFASALFVVLLSLMVLFSAADIISVAMVDPESYITSDSHVIGVNFEKGPKYNNLLALSVADYIPEYLSGINERGFDMDYIPDTNLVLMYYSDLVPQYGRIAMSLGKYNLVNSDRLDESTLVYGRMPERYDEIVVDRWVLRKCTNDDGIVQNIIPDNEYMIGKRVYPGRGDYYPTIVGICDSGQPSVYIPKAGLLCIGIHGVEAMPYSEFVAATGKELAPLEHGEAAVINENGPFYAARIGSGTRLNNGISLYLREGIDSDYTGEYYYEYGITTSLIIPDSDVDEYLTNAIETVAHFKIWCADKETVKKAFAEPITGDLEGILTVEVTDPYGTERAAFMNSRTNRLQTRSIIMGAIGLLCLVMLYVIQRFRVRDRMGLIAVYRMLGIPGRDTASVFVLENVLMALKFALPAIFLAWGVVTVLPMLGVGGLSLRIPLWVAFATLGFIILAEAVVAVIAVVRLLTMPPAKLAAKYDF